MTDRPIIIRRWRPVTWARGPYVAPELRGVAILGVVRKDPRRTDQGGETEILTSPVVAARRRLIRTESGTLYRLVGPPEAGWVRWMASRGAAYNDAAPFGAVGRP